MQRPRLLSDWPCSGQRGTSALFNTADTDTRHLPPYQIEYQRRQEKDFYEAALHRRQALAFQLLRITQLARMVLRLKEAS